MCFYAIMCLNFEKSIFYSQKNGSCRPICCDPTPDYI
jgi:hypothetical protein